MPILPDTRIGKVQFFETRLSAWDARAAEIGLDPTEVAELESRTQAARQAYLAAHMARIAARSATNQWHMAAADLADYGSNLLQKIKATASSAPDNRVYSAALIPPPADPSPLGAPGTPSECRFALVAGSGALKLTWKCKHPAGSQGTIYAIRRSVNNGNFVFLDTAGKKKFIDETLPPGSAIVVYEITAVRSTRRGQPARFNVNLGVAAGAKTFEFQPRASARGRIAA